MLVLGQAQSHLVVAAVDESAGDHVVSNVPNGSLSMPLINRSIRPSVRSDAHVESSVEIYSFNEMRVTSTALYSAHLWPLILQLGD